MPNLPSPAATRRPEHVRNRSLTPLVLAAAVGLAAPAPARGDIIAPNVPIAGQTQLQHANQWWNVMLNIPAATNPILDATGADAFRGQVGSVLYLAGSFGPSSSRSITIAPGTTLFFPLINSLGDNTVPITNPLTGRLES